MNRFFFTATSGQGFSLYRIFFYGALFLHLFVINDFNSTTWANLLGSPAMEPISFYRWLPVAWPLSPSTLRLLDLLFAASLICSALGAGARVAMPLAFLLGTFLIGLPFNLGKVNHSMHLPLMVMGIMAFVRFCGPWSIDRLWQRKMPDMSPEYRWPVALIWVVMCLIYSTAGIQKLVRSGMDWIFSDNMAALLLYRDTLTPAGYWVASFDWLSQLLALATVIVEVLAPIALIHPRLRFFIFGAAGMHLGSALLMGADGRFTPWLFCFVFWLPTKGIIRLLQQSFMYLRSRTGLPLGTN